MGTTAATPGPASSDAESIWITPNKYEWQGIIATIVLGLFVAVFLGLRMWIQKERNHLYKWDNIFLILAGVLFYLKEGLAVTNMLTGCRYEDLERPPKAWVLFYKVRKSYFPERISRLT